MGLKARERTLLFTLYKGREGREKEGRERKGRGWKAKGWRGRKKRRVPPLTLE